VDQARPSSDAWACRDVSACRAPSDQAMNSWKLDGMGCDRGGIGEYVVHGPKGMMWTRTSFWAGECMVHGPKGSPAPNSKFSPYQLFWSSV
jgi:hypothetical protein